MAGPLDEAGPAPPAAARRAPESSKTLDRGIQLLELLARPDRASGLTITELAARLDVGRPVVYRLVTALEAHHLVTRRPNGRVRLGLGVSRLAAAVTPLVRNEARPILQELADSVGATAHLTVSEGDEALALVVAGGVLFMMKGSSDSVVTRDQENAKGPTAGASIADVPAATAPPSATASSTPTETAAGIIPGATLIPVDELERRAGELQREGLPMLVYCAMGGRSAAACELLSRAGFDGLMNLEGGFSSWAGARERPRS